MRARVSVRAGSGLGASQSVLKKMGEALELNLVQTEELLVAVALLIEDAIFENRTATDVVAALPADLNKSLKQLIAAIVTKNMPKWRETVAASQISLPRLVDSDWRIDVKTASEVIARMDQPAVIVDLRVRRLPVRWRFVRARSRVRPDLTRRVCARAASYAVGPCRCKRHRRWSTSWRPPEASRSR